MQVAAAVAGLGGCCTTVDSYYMIPVVDGDDAIKVVTVVSGRPTREVARSHMPVGVKGSPRHTSLAGGLADMDPTKTYM
jgi:hypothetical protein